MELEVREDAGAGRVLTLSTLSFTLLFAVWLMLGVLAVPIKAEFSLSKVEFSWLTAIAVLSGSLFRLPVGLWADRVGGRKVMTAITLVTAVPCFAMAYANSYAQLMFYALCFGIAGTSFASGIAWNSAWFSARRQGVALGTFGAGNVGASVTKLIGPLLIALVPAGGALPGGWRFVPLLYTVLLIAMAVALWTLSPSPDRMPGAGRSLSDLLQPLKEGRVWRFGLYYVVVFGAYVALSVWLPNYYTTVYKLPLGSSALLTALFIFPASLLRPLGGYLSDRYGPRAVTYWVFVSMTVASIALSVFGPQQLGLIAFFLLIEVIAVGMGVGKASVYKYIPSYYPRDVGSVGGIVGTLGGLGGFVLPLGFGYIEEASHRPESCFWLVGFFALASWGTFSAAVNSTKRSEALTAGQLVES
jgi:MFS transporter, NNP family, nitrate/nitrite transporter